MADDSDPRHCETAFRQLRRTNTADAVKKWYRGHDRVVILTDEQFACEEPTQHVPDAVPVYTFNLAGYRYGSGIGANRHVIGGLSDASWSTIPLIEAAGHGQWPWAV